MDSSICRVVSSVVKCINSCGGINSQFALPRYFDEVFAGVAVYNLRSIEIEVPLVFGCQLHIVQFETVSVSIA